LYSNYQKHLSEWGNFDVDDVVIEALSRLNAPVWRRQRLYDGFDYIIVDEMHLFNRNEQSVFHYLTRDFNLKDIPICFAIDYAQAFGDYGETENDYAFNGFGSSINNSLATVFRNSPEIADFCAAIAASGTLMFQTDFVNPYNDYVQTAFTTSDEKKCLPPSLFMYPDEESMLDGLKKQLECIHKTVQCKANDIAIIVFDDKYSNDDFARMLSKKIDKNIAFIDNSMDVMKCEGYVLLTPYGINGLEFKGVILLGVDEGRVPQITGVSEISQHYVRYMAFNQLYLASSRAKYALSIMGSSVNGKSSCLEHAIENEKINVEDMIIR